jgi:hypothetical protein
MCRGEAEMSEFTFMKQDNVSVTVSGREYNFPPQQKSAAQLLSFNRSYLGTSFKCEK